MAAVDLEQALGEGLAGGAATDVAGEFAGELAGFLQPHLLLDEESLGASGEVEVCVEGIGNPEGRGFAAAVTAGDLAEAGGGRRRSARYRSGAPDDCL